MAKRRYWVHFEPNRKGNIHVVVPALPGFEASFTTYHKALDQLPGRIAKHMGDLMKSGRPVPTEDLPPICMPMWIKVPARPRPHVR